MHGTQEDSACLIVLPSRMLEGMNTKTVLITGAVNNAISQPSDVDVSELIVRPTAQG